MKTFIVTGASQGLGLAIARALHQDPTHRVVLAVRDPGRGAEAARAIGPRAEVAPLDLSSLEDVRRFAEGFTGPLAGLVNNAGVQQIDGTHRTADGWEETIGVNHLGALALTLRLLPGLQGGRGLFIGSGTHHPGNRTATMFGFRGARFTSVPSLARGEGETTDPRQLGMDRYATSKFLNTVTALELARRIPADQTAFFTLDPGMMAGTGLARTAPGLQRLLWSTVLRWVAPLLPDTSTPERSAVAAASLLLDPGATARSGEVFSFDGRPARFVWEEARRPEIGRAVLDQSLELLGLRLPAPASPACTA